MLLLAKERGIFMSEGICYLYGAGTYYPDTVTSHNTGDMIIAVDGGYDFLRSHGVKPDLLLGDFDSISSISDTGVKTLTFPTHKDYTDMYLAADEGMKSGYDTFVIYGGCGGRIDHTLSNIQLLSYITDNGKRAYLYADHYVVTMIKNDTFDIKDVPFIKLEIGNYISVLSHSNESLGVTISGLKYETDNIRMTNSMVLGTSNEYIGKDFQISVSSGTLIIAFQL